MPGWIESNWENPGPLAWLLSPLSVVYALGWEAYRATYALGFKRAARPHSPTICIGNLRIGGTGKTPVSLHVAEVVLTLGHQVVLGMSAYGSPASESAQWAPDGPLDAERWGDEPAMARWLMPNLPIVCGRDRVRAAELVARDRSDAVLVMDDGMQHLRLAPTTTVLIDPPDPANALPLPAGPYREPRWNRRRADLIVPGVLQIVRSETLFLDADAQETEAPGEPVSVITAVGRPRLLLEGLGRAGVEVERSVILKDHDPMTAGNLFDKVSQGALVLCTAKDWVKLRNRPDIGNVRVCVVSYRATLEPEAEFRRWLAQRIDENRTQRG